MLTGCGHNQYEVEAIGDEDLEDTRTSIDAERQKAWTIEWSNTYHEFMSLGGRYNLRYITHGNFVPASYDIDLQTIERFVFTFGGLRGIGLVIDRMHGRIYYNPYLNFVEFIDGIPFHTNFRGEDLSRLINAIERSNLHNWQEFYAGEVDRGVEDGGTSWRVGILFSDGTILRRGGGGHRNYLPPEDEFAILFNFIETLGAEIIQRHGLEIGD